MIAGSCECEHLSRRSDVYPPNGPIAALNALTLGPAFSPGPPTGAAEAVPVSLIICVDDPGAGSLGQP